MIEAEDELFDQQSPIKPEAKPEAEPTPITCTPRPVTPNSSPATRNPSPVTGNPPPATPPFPNVKKEWDKSLTRAEQELMELCLPRRDQKPKPFAVARAIPFTPSTVEELVAAQLR
jgi:hypothetical protein